MERCGERVRIHSQMIQRNEVLGEVRREDHISIMFENKTEEIKKLYSYIRQNKI